MDHIAWLKEITNTYPRFADGRIDYSNEVICVGVNCTVIHGNEALLAQRSANVIAYPNVWNGISGFVDELKPLDHIVLQELAEEVGILSHHIEQLQLFDKHVTADDTLHREWHIYPALVVLKEKPQLTMNWENKTAQWVPIHKVSSFDLMPGYDQLFTRLVATLPQG